jgi:VanZ family protein
MDPFYFLLSALYAFCIYFWAGCPLVIQINALNPFGLLHIPLYGFLAVLLLLALNTHLRQRSAMCYVLVGLVALCIAVADEVYQSFIPFRVGSFTDFLLDGTGIFLAMLIFGQVSVFGSHRRIRRFSKFPLPHYPV